VREQDNCKVRIGGKVYQDWAKRGAEEKGMKIIKHFKGFQEMPGGGRSSNIGEGT